VLAVIIFVTIAALVTNAKKVPVAVVVTFVFMFVVTKVTNFPVVAMVMRTCKLCFTRQTVLFLLFFVSVSNADRLLAVLSVIFFRFLVVVPR
jgi:hypothetical protein